MKRVAGLLMALAFVLGVTNTASAAFVLVLENGGNVVTIADGDPLDENPTDQGITVTNVTVGSFTVSAEAGSRITDPNDPLAPSLQLVSTTVHRTDNLNVDPLSVALTDTGYTFPVGPELMLTSSGGASAAFSNDPTATATVTYRACADPNNQEFGVGTCDTDIVLPMPFEPDLNASNSGNGTGVNFFKNGEYSLTLFTDIQATVSNVNVGGTGNLRVIQVSVPEPGSLTLFGTGLIALAGLARRRFRA